VKKQSMPQYPSEKISLLTQQKKGMSGMWDESYEGGGKQKMLIHAVDAYNKRHEIVLASNNEQEEATHRANLLTLKYLSDTCNQLVNKLK
jgi:hypothetical protein